MSRKNYKSFKSSLIVTIIQRERNHRAIRFASYITFSYYYRLSWVTLFTKGINNISGEIEKKFNPSIGD